jgi:signal transduction histidine kinase
MRRFRHELRTPLNHIIGFADILVDDAEDTGRPELAPPARDIRQAGYALLETIQTTLGELEALDRTVLEGLEVKLEPGFAQVRGLCAAIESSGAYREGEEQLDYLATINSGVDKMAATLRNQVKDFS